MPAADALVGVPVAGDAVSALAGWWVLAWGAAAATLAAPGVAPTASTPVVTPDACAPVGVESDTAPEEAAAVLPAAVVAVPAGPDAPTLATAPLAAGDAPVVPTPAGTVADAVAPAAPARASAVEVISVPAAVAPAGALALGAPVLAGTFFASPLVFALSLLAALVAAVPLPDSVAGALAPLGVPLRAPALLASAGGGAALGDGGAGTGAALGGLSCSLVEASRSEKLGAALAGVAAGAA